jgi:hypothetical protein
MNGPTDWTSPADPGERPILVPPPIARERADGVSLARQALIDTAQRGGS